MASRLGRAALAGAALMALGAFGVMPFACSSTSSSPKSSTLGEGMALPDGRVFHRSEMLRSVGACVLSDARAFFDEAQAIEAATAAGRAPARDAYRAAFHVWQRLEVAQIGPAGPSASPGGMDLRANIYSWPLGSRCFVEQSLVAKAYEKPDFAGSLVNGRSLTALDYLLFYDAADNGCPPASGINASGSWAALAPAEIEARKTAYARVVAHDVAVHAKALVDAWDPAGGDFVGALSEAGKRPPYQTDQVALNAVFDALFYIGFEAKDEKVGKPAGVIGCAAATCPEGIELPFAGLSKDALKANVEGFLRVFRGCDPAGLSPRDMLVAIGKADLGDKVVASAEAVTAAVDAIEEADLTAALAVDLPSVQAVYAALKVLNDVMKTELTTVLDLELPRRLEGDND